ncbi:RING/U-box superfamily protein [Rhynchospora pubera]|uniref:RING-type E3 ubiquitin transferase n=1 Tax=Rhynchospora pubera TaxID=906938 RepID=A0AAV8EBV1_9POAL|nr:RING/U-box superfamily protein [Rhynchospora pubera]
MCQMEDHLVAITRETNSLGLVLLFILAILSPAAQAQSAPPPPNDNNGYWGANSYSFNPSVAILIIVLISAFFFLGFFSVYVRNCGGYGSGGTGNSVRGALANAMARSRRQRGLEAAVLETFPIMVYSEVKEHKIGKGSLECAVCLCEFEDDEKIRLLPKCSHVFHTDCIDEWLSSHATCPVCRCNLAPDPNQPSDQTEEGAELSSSTQVEETHNPSNQPDSVVVIDVDEHGDEQMRQEAIELERIGSQRRALRAKSVRQQPKFPRSHSTGHSLAAAAAAAVRPEESMDKYTLRLPDHIKREIIASRQLKRASSLNSFPARGEASSRQGYRVSGEGSSRMGRSPRFGRSDRWPSFITRTFSARAPAWVTGRRGDSEGSVKKPDGEGSVKSKQGSVKGAFDCLGGAPGSKVDSAGDEEDEAVAIVRRV